MFIKFANILAPSFNDRPHDGLTFCTGIVSLGDDVVCEGIPTRLCQCQASCLEQIWLGQFHLGFKIPNVFMEEKRNLLMSGVLPVEIAIGVL